MKWRLCIGLAGVLLSAASNAPAAPQSLALTPADMLAQTHSHAMILRFTSTYRQLSGTLDYDPASRTCSIDVTFQVTSLTAPNAMLRGQMLSKNFLDPIDYPTTRYKGVCHGNRLTGALTLRGQTHPFDMAVAYIGNPGAPSAIHAQGVLDRHAWGVDGLRLAVGRDITVTNDVSLNGQPFGKAATK